MVNRANGHRANYFYMIPQTIIINSSYPGIPNCRLSFYSIKITILIKNLFFVIIDSKIRLVLVN